MMSNHHMLRIALRAHADVGRSHEKMKLKSYIPFLTVPLSVAMLTVLVIDAVRGAFDPSMDLPRYLIWGIFCTLWFVSGLIKWNKPYVTADDNGLTVRNRWFSNQPSLVIQWSEIKRCAGRTFWDFRVELLDGQTIKIPINGMSGSALGGLLSLIETKTGNANQALHATSEPAPGAVSSSHEG